MNQPLKIHIIPSDGKWAVRTHTAYRAWRRFPTKAAACEGATRLRKNEAALYIVHDETGRIARRVWRPAVVRP